MVRRRNTMKTLHLTLKKKWFDMTDIGDKPEEYREVNMYWWIRLVQCGQTTFDENGNARPIHEWKLIMPKQFDTVFARNGYNPKKNPSWNRKWLGTSIGYGQEKWGAEPGKKYFVIKLGEKV